MEQKKILIVEDEAPMRRAVKDKFSREGFTVFEARNGKEGLDAALKEHPDLILLDVLMPIMDGLEMLQHVRADEWGKNVPIVLLTNFSDIDKIAKALEDGASDFLVKSEWKLEDVVLKVKEKLHMS
jgi:DNA-binding response OmpR family regulator